MALAACDALDDEQIVERVRAGEPALFEILMRRHNQRIYRVARSIVRDEHETEDVMQQAYLNAYAHLDQFAGRARFSTWLSRIAAHEALGRVRRRRTGMESAMSDEQGREDRSAALAADGPTPEHQAFAAELRGLLEDAVDRLPVGYRQVFMLREVEGLSVSETAECLETSEEAIKTRLHRARGMIRDALYAKTGASAANAFQFHLARCNRVVDAVLAHLLDVSG